MSSPPCSTVAAAAPPASAECGVWWRTCKWSGMSQHTGENYFLSSSFFPLFSCIVEGRASQNLLRKRNWIPFNSCVFLYFNWIFHVCPFYMIFQSCCTYLTLIYSNTVSCSLSISASYIWLCRVYSSLHTFLCFFLLSFSFPFCSPRTYDSVTSSHTHSRTLAHCGK